ncbi:MAG: hypothetical protein JSV36_00060, partial [Anaerolineae bacterium]
LQEYGRASIEHLLEMMGQWSAGTLLERRAVVASLCEPSLLVDRDHAGRVLDMMDEITASILRKGNRRSTDSRVLRQALAYGWSVVVAAQPALGKPRMEKWIDSEDSDIRWIMKQNLTKKRLVKMDELWVQAQLAALGQEPG